MSDVITSSTAKIVNDPQWLVDAMRAGRIIRLPDLGYTIAPTADAEWDEDADMVSLRKKDTGIDNTIFVSTRGNARHAARVKVAIDPPDSLNAASKTASMAIEDYGISGARMSRALAAQVEAYIEVNRAALLAYWNEQIDTAELIPRLRPIPR